MIAMGRRYKQQQDHKKICLHTTGSFESERVVFVLHTIEVFMLVIGGSQYRA